MYFFPPLSQGILVKRYKRFFADIQTQEGNIITAHCVNTGAMLGLTTPGTPVWYAPKASGSKGKLDFVWMLSAIHGALVGTNTSSPMKLVKEGISSGIFPFLGDFPDWRAEVPIEDSRLDFCFYNAHKAPFYVEVKNVHLRQENTALFPDCQTTRGKKHVQLLTQLAKKGIGAGMLYIVQREDVQSFEIAGFLDSDYGLACQEALEAGVHFWAYRCHITLQSITLLPHPLIFKGVRFQQGPHPFL